MAVSRKNAPASSSAKSENLNWDLECAADASVLESLANVSILIHCAPIWLLPARLPDLIKGSLARLVVFSSTSVLSKQGSRDLREQNLVGKLRDAEASVTQFCAQHGLDLTILRPSMIYGFGLDQNVMHIARFIRRYHCMLLVGAAEGKRQPVHANDLASAALDILLLESTYAKTYEVAGGEVLSYRQMVERIFNGLQRKPRILSIPLSLFRGMLALAAKLKQFDYTPEMANRMSQDLCYDISAAQKDFGFTPQAFLLNPQRDLPEQARPIA